MITLFALVSSAFALDVDLHVSPPRGEAAWVTFHNVTPGAKQTVDVPCAQAPSCRLTVTLTPEGAQWLIAVNVFEVRKSWLGAEHLRLVTSPTFMAPTDQMAEMFIGAVVPVEGSTPQAFREGGLHIQARVRTSSTT